MKRLILLVIAAISLGCVTLFAQTVTNNEDGKYTLRVGKVSMVVDAAKGGK